MLLFLSLFPCYSKETNFTVTVYDNPVRSPGSSDILFVLNARAFQKGKPFWFIIPIEGQTKTLYNRVSLYAYNTESGKLTQIYHISDDLPDDRSGWKIRIVPDGTDIYLSINPLAGWDTELKRKPRLGALKEKYDGKIVKIDAYGREYQGDFRIPDLVTDKLNLQSVYDLVKELPLAAFGLVLKEIVPAKESYYLNQLASLANSTTYRRAVIEQILALKDQTIIQAMYDRMILAEKKLSSRERLEKSPGLESNFEMIRKLLGT